ncbi:nuclear transport factor 2 family protein [bacterium]|nr:nuclear transport factor 2 family protein [bacterium]
MDYVSKLSEAYESWDTSKGTNHEKWLELMSDHVVFRSLAGGTPGMEFTKECHSKDDVRGYFSGLYKDWEMIHYTPEQYITEGEHIAVRGSAFLRIAKPKKFFKRRRRIFSVLKTIKSLNSLNFTIPQKPSPVRFPVRSKARSCRRQQVPSIETVLARFAPLRTLLRTEPT